MAIVKSIIRRVGGEFVTGHYNKAGRFVDVRPCEVSSPSLGNLGNNLVARIKVTPQKGVILESGEQYIILATSKFAGGEEIRSEMDIDAIYKYGPMFEFGDETFTIEQWVRWGLTPDSAARKDEEYQAWRKSRQEKADAFLPSLRALVEGDELTERERRWLRRWAINSRKASAQATRLLADRLEWRIFQDKRKYAEATRSARAAIRETMGIPDEDAINP